MANTFPSTGNVGIGTSTPSNLLTIDAGAALSIARITGKSPIWLFGGTSGGQAHVGMVTANNDYVSGGVPNDVFFFQGTNTGRAYIGRCNFPATNNPAMSVGIDTTNSLVRVGIGIGVDTPAGVLTAAAGTRMVQLLGGNVAASSKTLALGYGDSYNFNALGEAGFAQVEQQGVAYRPLYLQPVGGIVQIGSNTEPTGATYPGPDQGNQTDVAQGRFDVKQWLGSVGPSGTHQMANFEFYSKVPQGADIGGARVFASQVESGSWIRALEVQVVRLKPTAQTISEKTWGLEVGVNLEVTVEGVPDQNVGIHLECTNTFVDPTKMKKANTGILIQGVAGWESGILYRDVNNFDVLFEAKGDGNVRAKGTFTTISSARYKQDITTLSGDDAIALLDRLEPTRFRFTSHPEHEHLGFIAEDVPAPIGQGRDGVGLMEVIAVLTRVLKDQQRVINGLQAQSCAVKARTAGGTTDTL